MTGPPMYCENCRAPQQAGAKYCPSCGHALGTAAAADAPTQVLPAQRASPTPIQPTPPPDQPAPGDEEQNRKRRDRTIAAVGAVVFLIAAAGLAALFLMPREDDYENQLQDVLVPVVDSNRTFNDAARSAEGGSSTRPLLKAAEDAAGDARRALDEAVRLEGGTTEQAGVVREALETEIAYADAVANRGGWDSIQLERLGVDAENAGARLTGLDPGFEPLVADPVINVANEVEQRRKARSAARNFAADVDAIVADAAPAYDAVDELAADVQQGTISVAEAGTAISGVINKRTVALEAATSLAAPDADSSDVKALLAESLRLSLENDEAFKQAVDSYNSGDQVAYLQNAHDEAYKSAAQATAKKRQFAAAYNAYLKSVGLPRNASERF